MSLPRERLNSILGSTWGRPTSHGSAVGANPPPQRMLIPPPPMIPLAPILPQAAQLAGFWRYQNRTQGIYNFFGSVRLQRIKKMCKKIMCVPRLERQSNAWLPPPGAGVG